MAGFVMRQDETNPVFWLATRVARWGPRRAILPTLDYPLSSKSRFCFGHIINPLLTKLVWPRCPNYYYPCIFIDHGLISVHKNAKGTWPTTSYLDLLLGQWCINNVQFCWQTQFKLHYTSLWLTPGVKESMGSLIIRHPRILNRFSLYYLHAWLSAV